MLHQPTLEKLQELQATNIAQALRIPENLRLLNLQVVDVKKPVAAKDLVAARDAEEDSLRELIGRPENVELLAEAEHNGWMVDRLLDGWTYARTRANEKKKHNLLIPYSQLTEEKKDVK